MSHHAAKLVSGSITGHLLRQTAPNVVGVAALISVGLVDAYFIGRLGSAELAAVSFIFPVTTALASLGVGMMAAVGSVVSRALGEGDLERARARANLGIVVGIIAGLVLGALLYLLQQPLFRLLQADAEALALIDEYMRPYALVMLLLLVMMAVNGALRGQGAAKRSTAIGITFAVANWILDPLLITGAFGFEGLGIAGAAWATGAGWLAGVLLAFVLLRTGQIPFEPKRLKDIDTAKGLKAIFRVAGPAAFSNSINPAGLAVLTALLAAEGQEAVAGFGAGGRLQTFAVVPLLALSGAIGAIIGQNWGACRADRALAAMVRSGLFCMGYGIAAGLAMFAFREQLAALFSDDPAVIAATAQYLQVSVWGWGFYGVLIVANGALNSIDRAPTALALSSVRVVLVMMPVAWLARGALGSTGVYAGELASNTVGGIAAAILAWFVLSRGSGPRNWSHASKQSGDSSTTS